MNFKGIVLAGGKSSRFGKDKALAKWKGRTLLERAVDLLDSFQLNPVVIASSERDYSFLSYPVERDLIPSKGPLGGLYTACSFFPGASLLVLTCDMPLVSCEVLKELMQSHQNSNQVTVFRFNQTLQPFPGIYDADLKTVIHNCLVSDELGMKLFLSGILNKRTLPGSSRVKVFQNVNRQEDLSLIADSEKRETTVEKWEFLTKS